MEPHDAPEAGAAQHPLTSGPRLAKNAAWNLVAQGAPLGVALVAIPLLLHRIGIERLGVLTLIWALVGYASLFDFGFGRALTKLIAERLGRGNHEAIGTLFWTGLALLLAVGLTGSCLLLLVALPWLVHGPLNVTPALVGETRAAFQVVALGIPFVIVGAGLRGTLEAHQRFRAIALVSGILGTFTFLGPLVALWLFAEHLGWMAAAVVISRALAAALYFTCCLELPGLRYPRWSRADIQPLVGFGSWMTITNLVGPIMDNMDRFLLGVLASVSVVAYYATPFDVVTRALLIPVALTGVLFPAFSTALTEDAPRVRTLFLSATRYVFLAIVPISLLVAMFAREGLTLWLGSAFAARSERIVQWLAAGVLVSALSKVPYALLQGIGRPDLTALAHVAELPLYLLAAWALIGAHGAEGAAIAWTLRVLLDSAILFYFACRQLPDTGRRLAPLGCLLAGTLTALYLIARAESAPVRILLGGLSIVAFLLTARIWIVDRGELERLLGHFTGSRARRQVS
jgi:O-antigen/teichoic acid export membrane protein